METEVFRWVCDICGKEIKSLYQKQLESHKQIHLSTKHGITENCEHEWREVYIGPEGKRFICDKCNSITAESKRSQKRL